MVATKHCRLVGYAALLACGLVFLGAVSTCARSGGYNWLDGAVTRGPIWSPDGAHIAFIQPTWGDTGGGERRYLNAIFTVDADGTRLNQAPNGPSTRELFETDDQPDISPDGSRIVYRTFRYPTGLLWNTAHEYEIATANLDGTDPKRLTKDRHWDDNPAWSPDGTRIAFVSVRGEDDAPYRQIFTMAPDGSDVRSITRPLSGRRVDWLVSRLAWSPDSRYIAYAAARAGGDDEYHVDHFIAVVSSDGSDYRRIVEYESSEGSSFSVVQGGRRPVWSPDGTRLAFTKYESGVRTLHTVIRDGSNARRVSDNQVNVDSVAWSPDGSELRFVSFSPVPSASSPDGVRWVGGVLSVKADGSDLRLVTEIEGGVGDFHAWSPDGSRIAVYRPFSRNRGPIVLYTIALDGSKALESDRRVLVRQPHGALVAENSAWRDASDDIAACSEGMVVPDPGKNPGLARDCETLLGIRDELSGEDVFLNWGPTVPIREWEGVGVSPDPDSRVEHLFFNITTLFSSGTLRGTLPPAIGALSGLTHLSMSYVPVTGSIPPELGRLSELELLQFEGTHLTGNIPPELGNLANLTSLDIRDNGLSGSIPPELGKLTNLKSLGLHEDLTGCIPAALVGNPNLRISTEGLPPC